MEEKTGTAALSGIRILDLSTMLAGPFGSMMLGDLGAEIIKIEPPGGDNTRDFPPHYHQGESLYYLSCNRNKKSVVLNLKSPEGLEVFYQMVKTADVVWDNFRSGVKQRLKLDYDVLKKINPRIICCSITAYGDNNPYDHHEPVYDLCIQAMSGVLSMTGEPDRPPVKLGVPMADLAGGWYGVVGVLAALQARERTGAGQEVDISMLDSLTSLLSYEGVYYLNSGEISNRIGTAHRSLVPYQIFKTCDGYIALVVARDKFWANLCGALERPELIGDERFATIAARHAHRGLVVTTLETILLQNSTAHWVALMKEAGVPCAPVNTVDKAFGEPALLHRNMVLEMEHRGEKIKVLGNPVKISGSSDAAYTPPPGLGEHTRELLVSMGIPEEEIRRLLQSGAIGCLEWEGANV